MTKEPTVPSSFGYIEMIEARELPLPRIAEVFPVPNTTFGSGTSRAAVRDATVEYLFWNALNSWRPFSAPADVRPDVHLPPCCCAIVPPASATKEKPPYQ